MDGQAMTTPEDKSELDHAREQLEKAREAYDMAREGQRFTWGDRTLTMADLPDLRRDVEYWERRVAEIKARRRGTTTGYSVAKVFR